MPEFSDSAHAAEYRDLQAEIGAAESRAILANRELSLFLSGR